MPRNSNGVYTLPQAAFVPNSVISSSAVNSDFSDIANALTDSVAASGVTSMTGQLKATSGSAGAPGLSFASDTTTGLYLSGTHQAAIATNGIQAVTFNSDQSVTFDGKVNITNINAPAFWTALGSNTDVAMIIDGLGAVISSGQKGQIHIPFSMTINSWRVMADQSGSIVIDVLRANNAVPSSSIVGAGNAPTLSTQQFAETTPVGWTSASLAPDDWIAFSVTSATTVTRVTICLSCTRLSSL